MDTRGSFTQASPNTDLSVFIGAASFRDILGNATFGSSAAGLFTQNLANNTAGSFFADIGMFLRTGQLATEATSQRQFGTAAGVPGPSAVAGTSGPLALPGTFPPQVGSTMATIAGSSSGAVKKGVQVNSVDVIYTVAGLALALAQIGLTSTVFANNVAPTVTSLITLGANGLPTAIQANPYDTNVAVGTPVFVTTKDTEILLNVKLTAGATGTALFYGVNLNCSFNFN